MRYTRRKNKIKHKHRRTKKRKKNIPKDLTTLSNSINDIIRDKLYKHYRNNLVKKLSVKNLESMETILQHSIREDLTKKKSYSPSINKHLVSIRSVRSHPIFACSDLSVLEKTISKKELKVQIIKNGKLVCISVFNPIVKDTFLNALKDDNINCKNIIPPIQFHTNCWFNTLFMCLFISDKGRKFTRYLRQAMIEGKLINGKQITPISLKNSLLLFNAAIEAVQNKNNYLSNSSLALNTNNIIHNIYRSIPKAFQHTHYGIRDVDEYGNPLAFYNDLIQYIGAKHDNSPSLKIMSTNSEVNNFLSGVSNENSDIVVVQLYNSSYSPNYAKAEHVKKSTVVHQEKTKYKLDSVVVRDNSHNHFACAITCNKREMIYDGAAFKKLLSKKWSKLLNKDKNWTFPGSKNNWNFKRGYQILFYYKA